MIFAAGLGTRLKPLTDTMPKALVEIGGKPLIERVVTKLRNEGFTHAVVNVHHFSDQIKRYLADNDFGIDIQISDETGGLLETGGGLKKAAHLFSDDSQILIHNVDILSNVDLQKFYNEGPLMMNYATGRADLKASATLLVSWRPTKRYLLFDSGMRLVGWTNIETGEVKSPFKWLREFGQEHPAVFSSLSSHHDHIEVKHHLLGYGSTTLSAYAFSGIHLFSPSLFPMMENYPDRFPIIDFYLDNCNSIAIKGYVKEDLQLMDVGKQETLHDAEVFLAAIK